MTASSRAIESRSFVPRLGASASFVPVLLLGTAVAQNFDLAGTQSIGSSPSSATISHLFVPPQGPVPFSLACNTCHESSATPEATPMDAWQGSMMAHAARDPLFFAQLDLTNSDATLRPQVAGMADMCLRCHSPVAWLEGRSANLTGMGFHEKDMFGVQCHVCHRLVDPSVSNPDPDFANIVTHLSSAHGIPPTYGNGMYVMDTKHTRRGPYSRTQMSNHMAEVVGDTITWGAVTIGHLHPVKNSAFHRSSNVCGTCHDVSNPTDRLPGFTKNDVQQGFPIERTWTEWKHSAFSAKGEAGNCQSCHMSGPLNGVGFGAPCDGADELGHINDIHVHDLTGGNAFIPQVIQYMKARYEDPTETNFQTAVDALYPPAGVSPFTGVNVTALDAGIERVKRTLKRAAYLEVQSVVPNLTVRVTNRTGHKLPTGYPEGRRMWLNVRFLNSSGTLIAESGRYESSTAALYHDQNLDGAAGPKSYDVVNYTDASGSTLAIGRPTKVWEGRMEFDPGAAGPHVEFHFALNNTIVMDNRIPPEGWNLTGYTDNRALPVIPTIYSTNGWQTDYGTGGGTQVHYDQFDYILPTGHDRVELTLYYQTASREYIEALRDDNPNDITLPPSPTNFVAGSSPRYSRGTLMYEAWANVGKSAPVPMAHLVYATADSDGDGLSDGWEAAHGLLGSPQGGYNDDPDGDGLANWQEFQRGSNPQDANDPTPGGVRQPVDIVLVLDTSGSMNSPAPGTSTPKIEVLRDAVTLFLETWRDYAVADRPGVTGDRIGVVYFNSTAQPYGSGVLLKNFVTEWENIRNDVQMRTASGWTAMGAGLHTAIQGFTDPSRLRHVILFGNGMQNRSPMIVEDAFGDLMLRDQTSAENPDVTGGSNVVIGGSDFYIPAGIKVHTIGIGVAGSNSAGTGWHVLLHDLAQQHEGKHNFITRAFELEGVFLEDLVESLKGNSLQYVRNEERLLAFGEEHAFAFPVNQTAVKFSLVVSWEDKDLNPPELELIRPDGRIQDLSRILREGTFYRIITHYLSDPDEVPADYGMWKLRVVSRDDRQLPLRVHALLDDAELKYQFLVPGKRFRIGEPVRITALATQNNRLLKSLQTVSVTLDQPSAASGELLAKSRHQLDNLRDFDPDSVATPWTRKLQAAFADRRWNDQLTPETSRRSVKDDGRSGDSRADDGIYSNVLIAPQIPGHYRLRFQMAGRTVNNQFFQRQETRSIIVSIGQVDGDRSGVHLGSDDSRVSVIFMPRDVKGNLLGPGYGSRIVALRDKDRLRIQDRLDGSYQAVLPRDARPRDSVSLTFDGVTFHEGPVPKVPPTR